MRVWRGLAASGVWLLAVAVVAGVAWFAIDSAGHEVGADGAVGLVVAPAPAPDGTPSSSPPSSSTVASSSPVPTQATTARDVRPSPSPSRPGPSRSTAPTGEDPTSAAPRPTLPEPGGSEPADGASTGAFSSTGGALVVRCDGARVAGWGLRPADGWRADSKVIARQELLVTFTSGDDSVIEVRAVCRESGPSFSAQSRSQQP